MIYTDFFLAIELNLRSNQLLDLPSSMGNLCNLVILDLDENPWETKKYNGNEIPELLTFLKGTYFLLLWCELIAPKVRKMLLKRPVLVQYQRTIDVQ